MDQSLRVQLRTILNTVPAFTWYSVPSGTLTFVNHRYADYLGLASDHPLRFGVGRVCQVVEKSERVIIPVMIATYYAARFTDPISFQPSIFRSFT